MNPNPELSISAFAAASRLSPKALRLYGELGLLLPQRIDPHNGYRYYSATQLPTAQLIALLRQLDLPLSSIRHLLDMPQEQQPQHFLQLWQAVQAEQQRRAELAQYIHQKLSGELNMAQYTVQTRFVEAQNVITRQYHVTAPMLPQTIGAALRELREYAGQHASSAAPFVIYHGEVTDEQSSPIEVCQPYQGQLAPAADLTLRLEPAHHEAFVTLTRPQVRFPEILGAYEAVALYAQQHGESGPLPCREVYGYDWDAAGDTGPAADVAWPYIPAAQQ